MQQLETTQPAAEALRTAVRNAEHGLVERSALVDAIVLAAVAGEHILVIGPPGTAKSEAVRRIARAVGGSYFEYLLGRFTEPNEIFGPVDLRKLREGVVETETAGMLPETEIAFLDEIFLGSTAILNTLLGILNERIFRRGRTTLSCPLRLCVGASNTLPEDESLAAFADRFLVRVFIDPIPDTHLEDLLESGWKLNGVAEATAAIPPASIGDLDALTRAAYSVDLGDVRPMLAHAIRLLRRAGIGLSDRRIVKTQRLIAAAAVLAGRRAPTSADLWPVILAIPTAEEQTMAREILRDLLAHSENSTLSAAAEEASSGPLARAGRLSAAGAALLGVRSAGDAGEATAEWMLKLEGIVREIDAGFTAEGMPAELAQIRGEIVAILGPGGKPAGSPPANDHSAGQSR